MTVSLAMQVLGGKASKGKLTMLLQLSPTLRHLLMREILFAAGNNQNAHGLQSST